SHYMADKILLIMVSKDNRYIAGALNFIGTDTLFGRYWGALENHPGLHFETCYYRAMEFAIAKGLKTVEAGAQGPHKLARGYVPVTTYSAHHITNPDFSGAIADYLNRERSYVEEDNEILSRHAPFKKGNSS
ncbi:MAG TPA: GNAT family N-acetyltransferase, partial [Rhizobiales bacterium]|nr:GNAT family N-acetyltransferase [Hyphomicrobiales bacterium]